jgi:hypothetical protein
MISRRLMARGRFWLCAAAAALTTPTVSALASTLGTMNNAARPPRPADGGRWSADRSPAWCYSRGRRHKVVSSKQQNVRAKGRFPRRPVGSRHLVATCGAEGTSLLNHLAKMASGDKAIGVPA